MSLRPHLIDSPDPLQERRTYTSLCGEPVADAHFVFVWDGDAIGHFDALVSFACRKCCEIEIEGRYVYGLLSHEKWMKAQHGESAEVIE